MLTPFRIACHPRRATLTLLMPLALGLLAQGLWPPAPRMRSIPLSSPAAAVTLAPGGQSAFLVSATAGTISLLDLAHGQVLRTLRLGQRATATLLALDAPTHHLFVAAQTAASPPGQVQMLDSRSGRRLARVVIGQDVGALAVDARHDQVLVADAATGMLALLDARTAAVRGTVSLGLLPLALSIDPRTDRAFVIGPATASVMPQLDLIAGSAVGLLAVLDTRSGTVIGRISVGSDASALAVDPTSGHVFVACTDDTVRMLDARTGAPLRTVTLEAAPSALAVDERRGRIYVISAAAGTLSLLDAQTGAPLATRRIDPTADPSFALPDALAVDEVRDRVYLSTFGPLGPGLHGRTLRGNGTLYVLEARTGAVLRRIAVGVAPVAVAVDERSGQVVVVNGGGEVLRAPADWGALWIGRLRQWLPWLGRGAAPQPTTERVSGSVSVIDGAP
jgi:DNA-binding beta-propeller fold protein YncE